MKCIQCLNIIKSMLWKNSEKIKKIKKHHLVKHETKRNVLFRFFLILAVFLSYFIFVSFKYGLSQGFGVTILTWSFFVFCTPIADAGFLLDFPIRLILKIRMIFTEALVWLFSLGVALYFSLIRPEFFAKSALLQVYENILNHPIPLWSVILLSMIGTFTSVYFGDELLDVVRHQERSKFMKHGYKLKIIIGVFLLLALIFLYYFLLKEFNINFI